MTITLGITGMTCNHCVHSVTKALQAVAGVENVSVNLGTGRASVVGKANPGDLVHAVEEEGYQAQVVKS